jgi:hypothetical protein
VLNKNFSLISCLYLWRRLRLAAQILDTLLRKLPRLTPENSIQKIQSRTSDGGFFYP